MAITLNGSTGIASPGGDTSTSLTTTTLTATNINSTGSTGSINSINTFGFKNRIINGGMVIDQRNGGASVTPASGDYTLDRWQCALSQASKFTVQQNAGSVTPPAGFINYLGVTSSSAYSVTSSDIFSVLQKIEGLNSADLGWGTASAKTVTLSFWVRSSLTGTFGGSIQNSALSRSYPFSYTVSSANTWTQISVTVAGDTTGTWLTTSGVGIRINFSLGTGTTSSGTAGAWAAADYRSATGAVSVVGTNAATFYITGVQLEVGSQATSFDFRDYGRELILCQRYFQIVSMFSGGCNSSTAAAVNAPFQTPMRSSPSAAVTGAIQMSDGTNDYLQSSGSISTLGVSTNAIIFFLVNFTGLTTARPAFGYRLSGNTNVITLSAEL